MRRLVTLALASASMFAMTAGDAAAAGKNPPTSCGMGNLVSEATLEVGGIGNWFHSLGFPNVGHRLQPFHEEVKEECNFEFGGL
jgi:hypothetical protein